MADYQTTWIAPDGDGAAEGSNGEPQDQEEHSSVETPGVGVYQGVSFFDYTKWDAINASSIEWGLYSMSHMQAYLANQIADSPTPAKKFGSAVHCRLLEPHLYYEKYMVATGCKGILGKTSKRAGQECGGNASLLGPDEKWYCGKHAPQGSTEPSDYVSEKEAGQIEMMAQKIKDHKVAKLLRQHGGFEASVIWKYGDVMMKSRLDKLIPPEANCPPTIVDIKKCRLGGASTHEFSRSIDNYNYALRAAFYMDAYHHAYDVKPVFIWVAIEDVWPHEINVLQCDYATQAIGRFQYRDVMESYFTALDSGQWPGYCNDIRQGGLPEYVKRRFSGLIE